MKNVVYISLFIAFISLNSCSKRSDVIPPSFGTDSLPELSSQPYDWESSRTEIAASTDMVLLYGGGHHRTVYRWAQDRVQHYVTYTDQSNVKHWLFDSFLFLEIMDYGTGGANKMFANGYSSYVDEAANQEDWTKLIDYYFQSETGIGAIDKCVESAIPQLGQPSHKRQVIISIPEPIAHLKPQNSMSSTTYWGKVDNVTLDFSKPADKLKACQWFIDAVRAKFNQMKYKNVELGGFYWLAEKATDTRDILNGVADYLDNLKYSFNWIPYYGADGYNTWASFGFHYAYFQPNYFFNDATPESRLRDACQKAIDYNMNMELEFDDNALASNGRGYKLTAYMNIFKEYNVWKNKRLAYYQGSASLLSLKNSGNAVDRQLYHDFCKFVITRPIRDSH